MAGAMRSPNYPALSLPQAVEAVRKLWSQAKRTPVSHDDAAKAMGFKSLSGPARVTIGAMRQYGLVEKSEKGHIRISDAAVTILHGNENDRAVALSVAAIEPELFQELNATHSDASEPIIRSYLITKKAFAEDGARKAAKAFKETMALAQAGVSGYTAPDEQEKPQAMAVTESAQVPARQSDGTGVLSLKVPYGAGALNVEIRVTGERLKRAHIERVRKYLELAESDLSDGEPS